jgi:aminopeptidase N
LKRYISLFFIWALCLPLTAPQTVDIHSRPEQLERSRDYDALHYRLEFRFDRENKRYFGTNTITLRPLQDDFTRCVLDAEHLIVDSVHDSGDRLLEYEQTDRHLIVTWPSPLAYHEAVTFSVQYSGEDSRNGIKFIDAAETHPAQINTYGWPENNHHWFPCFDFPNDKVTNELIVTARAADKVLSNGRLVGVSEDKTTGTRIWHWSQEKPHPVYCITMTVGPYEIIEDACGDIPVNYWVYPKDVPHALRSFEKTPRMIDFFSRIFDFPYPWAKYDQICVAGSGGGIENTSATVLGHGTIHDARADQDFSSESLVAHELAHMWWGDMVTERTWSHVWLSESFATYAEYLWARHDLGEDEGAVNLNRKKESYLREARTRYIRPLVFNRYNYPWDIMDSHSYPMGAVLLHMLRFEMGDREFFRALSYFLHKNAYGVVDTHDLMRAVKESTGRNLDWFFEQWVFKPGHPVFDVQSTWDAGSQTVTLKIHQVQETSRGIPVFRTPVLIGIHTEKERRSEKIWIDEAAEEFVFECDGKPLLVRFDEGNHLLKEWTFPKGRAELLYQLQHDDVIGRMWAAGELSPYLKAPGVAEALKTASKNDPFWSVRVSAIEALSRAKRMDLTAFFKESCLDQSSKVRTVALRALGALSDPDTASFFQERFRKDDSYAAQAEALRSLGRCGGRAHLAFLEKAAALPSPRNVIRRAAETVIKQIKTRK